MFQHSSDRTRGQSTGRRVYPDRRLTASGHGSTPSGRKNSATAARRLAMDASSASPSQRMKSIRPRTTWLRAVNDWVRVQALHSSAQQILQLVYLDIPLADVWPSAGRRLDLSWNCPKAAMAKRSTNPAISL